MSAPDERTEYESTVVPHPWWVAFGVIGFIIFAAIMLGVLYPLYLTAAPGPLHITTFSAPRLQIDPSRDLERVEKAQRTKLNRTEWRNGKGGTLTIPIGAAVKAVAARGADAFKPLPNAPKNASTARPQGATAPGGRRFNPGAGRPNPYLEGQ